MYIYIIECSNGSLYTGVAKDIEKRLSEHFYHKKQSAKYTKSHQMTSLKALWKTETKQDAMKLEYRIKTLTHSQKLELILQTKTLGELFLNTINPESYEFIDSKKQELIMQKITNKED